MRSFFNLVDDVGGYSRLHGRPRIELNRSWSTNIAIGRFTARLTWNIASSTSRLGFSRSIRMMSGSTA